MIFLLNTASEDGSHFIHSLYVALVMGKIAPFDPSVRWRTAALIDAKKTF